MSAEAGSANGQVVADRSPGARRTLPLWRRPRWLLWLVLAVTATLWLILHMPGRTSPLPPLERILQRLDDFADLFCMVGVAAFLGGLMEARLWHLSVARVLVRFSRLARLPEVVGLAMPVALYSNAAANGMLVNSHAEGQISRAALIAGGMANSYLAYVSHSIRVMYPVIGAVGLAGVCYFVGQFSGGLLVIAGIFAWNRHRHPQILAQETAGDAPVPLAWGLALRRAGVRTLNLLFRMVCLTVPLMLGMEWLLRAGAFAFWEDLVPPGVNRFFPVELVSVVAAQLGGLVQSASVAANLRAQGLIDSPQILLAMLVGSAIGNPFRTLRRNLPSAIALFPFKTALTIVLGMQAARLVTTLLLAGLVILYMHAAS